jgi:hypothetical protein
LVGEAFTGAERSNIDRLVMHVERFRGGGFRRALAGAWRPNLRHEQVEAAATPDQWRQSHPRRDAVQRVKKHSPENRPRRAEPGIGKRADVAER